MTIGDTSVRPDGSVERVISETPIRNYCIETPEQEAARVKKGLPPPMYGYIAVKVETIQAAERQELDAKTLLKMSKEKRQAHYQAVLVKSGQAAVDKLLNEVKKQRRLEKSKALTI